MKSPAQHLLSLVVFGILTVGPLSSAAQAQQVWSSPGDDLNANGVVAHPDFMRLFDSPSPWPTGLGHVKVMQLRAPWFLRMPLETDHGDPSTVTGYLKWFIERGSQ